LSHKLEVGERRSLASHYTLTTGHKYRVLSQLPKTSDEWYALYTLEMAGYPTYASISADSSTLHIASHTTMPKR